jgi:hypothetical protein
MKKFMLPILSFACFLFINKADAQVPQWVNTNPSESISYVTKLLNLNNGNIAVAGYFYDSLNTGFSGSQQNMFYVTDPTSRDIFLGEYALDGSMVWSKQLTGTADKTITDLKTDNQGNIYMWGYYKTSIVFETTPTPIQLSKSGSHTDAFIAKFSPSGTTLWAKTLVGSTGNNITESLAIDPSNNIYLTGAFQKAVDFNPDPNTSALITSSFSNNNDAYVLKLNQNGIFQWVRILKLNSSNGGVGIEGIGLDNSNSIFLTGTFRGTVDFDPGPDTTLVSVVTTNAPDGYVMKMNSNGAFAWVNRLGSSNLENMSALAMKSNGNVVVAGKAANQVSVGAIHNEIIYQNSTFGKLILYAAEYDTDGNHVNGVVLESTENSSSTAFNGINDLYIDADDITHMVGAFRLSLDINPDTSNVNYVTHNGGGDFFYASYDNNFNLLNGFSIGGSSADNCYAVIKDTAGGILLGGYYNGTCDFHPDTNFNVVYSSISNAPNLFFARYDVCSPVFTILNPEICGGENYMLPDSSYVDTAMVFNKTYAAINGCDSIVTINLTVYTLPNIQLSVNGNELSVVQAADSYQWIDCDTELPVQDEENQTFTASVTGSYAVDITTNNCSVRSTCENVVIVGTENLKQSTGFKVYPNPSQGSIFIESSLQGKFQLINQLGEVVQEFELTENTEALKINIAKGLYFLKAINHQVSKKIVVMD